MRAATYILLVLWAAVAAVRADESKRSVPLLTLDGSYQLRTDKEIVGSSGPVASVAFSPDGKWLVSASSVVKVWEMPAGKEARVLQRGQIAALAFSPDGKRLVTASGERQDARLKIWELGTGKELLALGRHPLELKCAAYSPDGKRLASGSSWGSNVAGPNVKVWDADSGKELFAFADLSGEAFALAFSPDGKQLAVGTRNFKDQREARGIRGEIRFWDLTTGQLAATWKHHGQHVNTLAYSPDGKQVALGITSFPTEKEPILKICDLSGKVLHGLDGEEVGFRTLSRIAYSRDGKRLAAVYSDKVKIWQVATGKLLRTIARQGPGCVAFSPDGAQLAVGDDHDKVTLWDVSQAPDSSP
jgi:WD40 repeat protein